MRALWAQPRRPGAPGARPGHRGERLRPWRAMARRPGCLPGLKGACASENGGSIRPGRGKAGLTHSRVRASIAHRSLRPGGASRSWQTLGSGAGPSASRTEQRLRVSERASTVQNSAERSRGSWARWRARLSKPRSSRHHMGRVERPGMQSASGKQAGQQRPACTASLRNSAEFCRCAPCPRDGSWARARSCWLLRRAYQLGASVPMIGGTARASGRHISRPRPRPGSDLCPV